ncbi:DUF2268 domain-containing protein [Bacillus ndiopicus]|uniref:DUF2268 domain-containing protein n=1 Tax=Bacillus ndiopicus TaxID=1347368 RepID=UPI0006950AD0|nr:DUF2268 domain-containing putative Zn-dependent protease [Bacillus ndiopicus]
MGVIATAPMLAKMIASCKNKRAEGLAEIHCEVLCAPLQKLFPWASKEAIQYELLSNGLFQPNEWKKIKQTLQGMQQLDIWAIVQKEYGRLRTLWEGPDVPIYIFPITAGKPKKNGVAYPNALFLFVSTSLPLEEIHALLAHEYNHICRLQFLNRAPSKLTLQDSLIIEGLAECAVEELYGEKWLSPWTKRYTMKQILPIWQKHFVPALQLIDVENHQPYLFGNQKKLPPWIGYCIGYRLVKSFQKKKGLTSVDLLQLPAQTIVDDSSFHRLS